MRDGAGSLLRRRSASTWQRTCAEASAWGAWDGPGACVMAAAAAAAQSAVGCTRMDVESGLCAQQSRRLGAVGRV